MICFPRLPRRLAAIAEILGVPIAWFFVDRPSAANDSDEEKARRIRFEQPETIELVRFYYAIGDPNVRRQFLQLVQSVAASSAS